MNKSLVILEKVQVPRACDYESESIPGDRRDADEGMIASAA